MNVFLLGSSFDVLYKCMHAVINFKCVVCLLKFAFLIMFSKPCSVFCYHVTCIIRINN